MALLRGVGGPTALKMAPLRAALTDAGLAGVATLQVAGNIIFEPEARDSSETVRLIRRTVHDVFGHDLPVIVRTHEQLVGVVTRNPFSGTQEGRWVMTVFLEHPPDLGARVDTEVRGPDRFAVDGAEVFVRYEHGVAGSKLQSAWFERQLGVVGTARNANTIAKLLELSAVK